MTCKLFVVDLKEPVVVKIPPKLEPVNAFSAFILVCAEPVKLFNDVNNPLTPDINVESDVSKLSVTAPDAPPPLKPLPAVTDVISPLPPSPPLIPKLVVWNDAESSVPAYPGVSNAVNFLVTC